MTNNHARLVYQSLLGVSFFTVTCYYLSGDDLPPNPEKKSERKHWSDQDQIQRKVKDAKIQIKKDKVCKLSTMLAVLVTILALHEP